MARRGDYVIGIDLGKHLFKGVSLRQKGDSRPVLTSFASREVPEVFENSDALAWHLKLLLRDLDNNAKSCALAVSDPHALLRIIEQPETPVHLLRNACRLHGLTMLNQDCKDFVLDVAPVSPKSTAPGEPVEAGSGGVAVQRGVATTTKYLVGGMLRQSVKQISEALAKARIPADIIQLAPICSFNAFEFAYPEIFHNDAFLLLDMGYLQSTVLIGNKGELLLVRSIDYGAKNLIQALTADGALEAGAAWVMIQQSDAGMADICRGSLARLATEVRNSIGFFEGQREESIHRVFLSGGLARTETVLHTLSDDLGLPCEVWDTLETCEVALSAAKREVLAHDFVSLNVACGAAFEYFQKTTD
jgi:Tfp pilus assembly PilM family ATPase